MTQVVVLAGGLGTRLGARAHGSPKVLVEVAGRPFLDRLLARIAASRVDEVLILAGHLADRVRSHVDAGTAPLRVVVHDELQAKGALLGTGGALRAALPHLRDTFVVTYGDSFLALDYAALDDALTRDPAARGAMAVWRNADAIELSNARVEGNRVVAYDKAVDRAASPARTFEHIDYGATALRRSVVEARPDADPFGLDVIQHDLAARGELLAFEVSERFYEIGSPEGIAALEAHLAREGAAA